MTVTSGSDSVTDLHRSSADVPSNCHELAIVKAVDLGDVALAMVADHGKVRRVKGKKKVAEPYKMLPEERPNPILKGNIDEGGMDIQK